MQRNAHAVGIIDNVSRQMPSLMYVDIIEFSSWSKFLKRSFEKRELGVFYVKLKGAHEILRGERYISFFSVLFEFPASTYADIQMKGVLVLGQTKDSTPDGKFDEAQSFSGRMAQFGLWDRVLAHNEISQMAGAILWLNSLPLNLQRSFSQRLQVHYCRESVFVWLLIFIGYVEKEQCQFGKCHWHNEFLRSIGCTEQAGIARNPTTSYS